MSFLLTLDLIDEDEREEHKMVYERARAAGTPFISFFSPSEILAFAREAGFKTSSICLAPRSSRVILPVDPTVLYHRAARRFL